jgi:DNA-binding GntR family transcriptional regulator
LVAHRYVLSDSTASENAICDEHSALLDAIRQGDVQAAQERMEFHMNNDIQRGLVNFGAP